MEKFVLKKDLNLFLIATLDLRDISTGELEDAYPIIKSWIKDMTNGEINIDSCTIISITSINSNNFMVCCIRGLVKVYKKDKPSFYIEEIKE